MKTKYRIIGISPKDAFYPDRKEFIGRECTIVNDIRHFKAPKLPENFTFGWIKYVTLKMKGPGILSNLRFYKIKIIKI